MPPIARPLAVDRRRFLAAGATAAGAAFAGPLAASSARLAEEDRWTMRLSASSINYTALPVEEACRRIAALGFEAVDLWSAHAGCPHLDDVAERLGANGLKELLDETGLTLYSFSVYVGGYERYAELLGKAGGGVAVRESRYGQAEDVRAEIKALVEQLHPLADLAGEHDSYLAIENHSGAILHSLDSIKAFCDFNDHPRLGIALAPYHLQIGGFSVEEAIALCGEQLLYFYAWQHDDGLGQLPGYGPTDFVPWLKALAEIDYPWYVNPFMHGEPEPEAMTAALAKSRDYLREAHAKAVAS